MEHDGSNKTCNHIILVHGASHGAWCWYKLSTLLTSAGYRVTVPDLAAAGIDERRLEEVPTFADYNEPLLEILRSLPAGERVMLVGHSYGGVCIALAAEMFPEKVAAAVFLTAFLPDCTAPPSFVVDKLFEVPRSVWMDTQFKTYTAEDKRPASMLFGPQFLELRLYQLSPPEDITLAKTLIRITSLFLDDLRSRPPFTADRYGSVDKVFIVCEQDFAIPGQHQRWMIENYPVKEVKSIEAADHMAMISKPKELCQCLIEIASKYS
ncbi:salicylic acid-binding protein 2-like [Typha angustifolia]|uniref:salicylic acid-binding protein 2-like n=1 Tax=Typha angustifolia TaxID=59011 RepID=UPI003C2ADF4A